MIKTGKYLVLCSFMVAIFFSSSFITGAFLSKPTNKVTNIITEGEVEINLEEPDWDPENAEDILPRDTVRKNPSVKNTGKNECRVFLEVKNPIRTVSLVDHKTKMKLPPQTVELFAFHSSENWKLLEKREEKENCVYLFGYTEPLPVGKTTDALFQELEFVNVLEGELDPEEELDVEVTAYAIQILTGDEEMGMEEFYQLYIGQAMTDTGKVERANENEIETE